MDEKIKSYCADCEPSPEKLSARLYRYWKVTYGVMFASFALAAVALMAFSLGVSLSKDLDREIQRVDGEGVSCYLYQKAMSCITREEEAAQVEGIYPDGTPCGSNKVCTAFSARREALAY